uniref:Uncharacterized protein n=1 Tax=Tetradesmus obliquus TaxID=3088 RepID=A0A383W3A5_TETOB|eukprot:jgi/Sobl393_1/16076/SZX71146.1
MLATAPAFRTGFAAGWLDIITVRRNVQTLSCTVADANGAPLPSAACTSLGLIRSTVGVSAAVCATTDNLVIKKCTTTIAGTTTTRSGGSCDAHEDMSKIMAFIDCGPGGRYQLKPWKIEWDRVDVNPKP